MVKKSQGYIDQNVRLGKKSYVSHPEAEQQARAAGDGPESDYQTVDLFTEKQDDKLSREGAGYEAEDYSVKGDEMLSDAELLRRFIESSSNNILPNIPQIPGFHSCWVANNNVNKQDTIDVRRRIGYSIVKPEEIPNYDNTSNRGAEHEGCVSFNELVLMKLPERLYHMYMRENHHTSPLEQERSVKERMVNIGNDKEGNSVARDLNEMSGVNSLARKVKEPTFN